MDKIKLPVQNKNSSKVESAKIPVFPACTPAAPHEAGVGLSAGNSTFPAKGELWLEHLHGIQQGTGIPGHMSEVMRTAKHWERADCSQQAKKGQSCQARRGGKE